MSADRQRRERQRQLDVILAATLNYYQAKLEPEVIEMYHDALDGLPIDKIKRAFTAHIKTSKWFPKISEILERVDPRPAIESSAEQQAAVVVAAMRTNGYLHEPKWTDPVTAHLFAGRYNWRSLCETLTEEETKWFVKEFKVAYAGALDVCAGDPQRLGPVEPKVAGLLAGIGKKIN
jgi:hypothetical protein